MFSSIVALGGGGVKLLDILAQKHWKLSLRIRAHQYIVGELFT
jgi:hypothetical protein